MKYSFYFIFQLFSRCIHVQNQILKWKNSEGFIDAVVKKSIIYHGKRRQTKLELGVSRLSVFIGTIGNTKEKKREVLIKLNKCCQKFKSFATLSSDFLLKEKKFEGTSRTIIYYFMQLCNYTDSTKCIIFLILSKTKKRWKEKCKN